MTRRFFFVLRVRSFVKTLTMSLLRRSDSVLKHAYEAWESKRFRKPTENYLVITRPSNYMPQLRRRRNALAEMHRRTYRELPSVFLADTDNPQLFVSSANLDMKYFLTRAWSLCFTMTYEASNTYYLRANARML